MSLDADFFYKLDKTQKELLINYEKLLLSRLQPAGLIGPGDLETIRRRHTLDSLLPLRKKEFVKLIEEAEQIADLGSGAGLPGIPLAISFPEVKFQLVDASIKRIEYLRGVVEELDLRNISLTSCSLGSDKFSEPKADIILFRAFRKPLAALELALYVAKQQSKFLYWRIKDPFTTSQSQTRLNQLGCTLKEKFLFEEAEQKYGIFLFEKNLSVNKMFPRTYGKIQKDQLVQGVI